MTAGTGRYRRRSDVKMTDEQVRAAHVLYEREALSLRQLGRLLWERFGYASPRSCANSLYERFQALGLPLRDQTFASQMASTTHGRGARVDKAAYKRWKRRELKKQGKRWRTDVKPRSTRHCTAVRTNGKPCRRFALVGRDVCVTHAPERRDGWLAHVAAMRERSDA